MADACALLFLERLAETWEAETGRVFPFVPPVIRRADTEVSDDAPGARSHASPQPEGCDSPAKDEKTDEPAADNLSYVEATEFEPEPEPRGASLADAELAAHACLAVGVERVKVVFVDDTKERGAPGSCTFAEEVTTAELLRKLPAYLARNVHTPDESFTVRLRFKGDTRLIQLDDCPPEVVAQIAPLCFLVHATSPGNAQAWLCLAGDLSEDGYEEARYRLLNSPRVQLLRVSAGRRVTLAEPDAAGLLAPPRPEPSEADVRRMRARLVDRDDWPDMAQYLAECDGDRSRAESKWCVRALSMGHSQYDVEDELTRIGEKARVRRRDNYVRETVSKAARFVGFNPPRPSPTHPAQRPATPPRERGTI